ncbi:MAG: hypothetical protein KF892_23795 [Rhizobacter sp.]|nr:hypothetical protein [Rhizobacter sp.]
MSEALIIHGHLRSWTVTTSEELRAVLSLKDSRGGGLFWLSLPDREFPCVAIRSSGPHFDAIYFPDEGHAGYWCCNSSAERPETSLLFQYESCDPFEGEIVEAEFVISFDLAISVADHFMKSGAMYESAQWFEI